MVSIHHPLVWVLTDEAGLGRCSMWNYSSTFAKEETEHLNPSWNCSKRQMLSAEGETAEKKARRHMGDSKMA